MSPHLLTISSIDRNLTTYQTPSSYVVYLPKTYKNVKTAKLVSAEIPLSYYVFSASLTNTTIQFKVGGTTSNITLPDGNYNVTTFASTLQTVLNTAFSGTTFTVSISLTTLKITITATSSFTVTPLVTTTNSKYWGLGAYMGLSQTSTYSGTTVVSDYPVVLNPYTYLMLDINELNQIGSVSRGTKSGFAILQTTGNSFDMVQYSENEICSYTGTEISPYIGKLDRVTVNWRFWDGSIVNFNNIEHSFTLMLDCDEPTGHGTRPD